jgi:PAS domain S-box-containing protein
VKDELKTKQQLLDELATLRVRAEEALGESEARLGQIIQQMPYPVEVCTPDGTAAMVNQAFLDLFGVPSADLVVGKYNVFDDPFTMEVMGLREEIERVYRGEVVFVPEIAAPLEQIDDKYGVSERVVKFHEIAMFPVLLRSGEIWRVVTMWKDVTERVRAEEALRRRNRELTMLNQIIAASASGLELEAVLQVACRELAQTFDVPQAAVALLNEDKTEASVAAEYLADGRPSALGHIIPVAGNPSFQHLLNRKTPLVVSDAQNDPRLAPIHHLMGERGTSSMLILPLVVEGDVVGSLGLDAVEPRQFSAEDIGLGWSVAGQVGAVLAQARLSKQRQRLEAQYHQAQKMEAVGRLTAGIAHDFNNLLTAINGFAELMQFELWPEDPLQELLAKILHSGRRAADLVRQLLAFSRNQISEPQVLDLNVVVSEMGHMLRRIITENIELETSLTPDLWAVKADLAQIEQVIVNLAVNARDAMPAGGKLVIKTANLVLDEAYVARHLEAQPGEHVLVAVTDTGMGMSEEVQAHLFEPFFTTKELGKGTGLGLATVYGIVKQSGGHVWVESEEGQGTTFKIYLPRARETARAALPPRSMADMPWGGETVLLVEDDEGVRDLAGRVLRSQGYNVLEAQDGQEALRVSAFPPSPIDLLLADVVMPGISGKVLADQLTQTRPDLKVLFMSGYTDEEIVQHGVLEPGIVLLQKPFNPMALARKVRQVLDAPE